MCFVQQQLKHHKIMWLSDGWKRHNVSRETPLCYDWAILVWLNQLTCTANLHIKNLKTKISWLIISGKCSPWAWEFHPCKLRFCSSQTFLVWLDQHACTDGLRPFVAWREGAASQARSAAEPGPWGPPWKGRALGGTRKHSGSFWEGRVVFLSRASWKKGGNHNSSLPTG